MSSDFSVDVVLPSGEIRRCESQAEYRAATGRWPAHRSGLHVVRHTADKSGAIDDGMATVDLERECRDWVRIIRDRTQWLAAGGWPEAAADIRASYVGHLPPAYRTRIAQMAGCAGVNEVFETLEAVEGMPHDFPGAAIQKLDTHLYSHYLDYTRRESTIYQDAGGWWQVSEKCPPRSVGTVTHDRDRLRAMADGLQTTIDRIVAIDLAMSRIAPIVERLGDDAATLTGAEEAVHQCAAAQAEAIRCRLGSAIAIRGDGGRGAADVSAILRSCDPATHRRRIRTRALRGQYDAAAALALVGVRSGGITADHTAAHYVNRRKNAARWASLIGVIPADAEAGTRPIRLVDIQKTRKDARLASMYALTRAYADEAQDAGLQCVFGTITLPGDYHPAPKSMGGMPNPNWDADLHNADAARRFLGKIYRGLIRRLKNRDEFRGMIGIKVPEPHQDGVPHLHFVLWVTPYYTKWTPKGLVRRSSASLIRRLLREIMFEYSDHDEKYKKHGGKIKVIEKDDSSKASPASYVMKYITKSLMVPDASAMDIHDDGVRYLAQMSAIGMRSFSFLGLRGIRGIYDRLYRMADAERVTLRGPWRIIADIVADSRVLWEESVEKTGFDREEKRAESREKTREALRLLGAFPHYKSRYTVSSQYKDVMTQYLDTRPSLDSFFITDAETGDVSSIPAQPMKMALVDLDDSGDDEEGPRPTGTGLMARRLRRQVIDLLADDVDEMTSGMALRLSFLFEFPTMQLVHDAVMSWRSSVIDVICDPSIRRSKVVKDIENACKMRMDAYYQLEGGGTYSYLPKGSATPRADQIYDPSSGEPLRPEPPPWGQFLRPIDALRLLSLHHLERAVKEWRERHQ